MSAVSEAIVREFFELNGFLVRQQRKYIAQNRREDGEMIDFFKDPQLELFKAKRRRQRKPR